MQNHSTATRLCHSLEEFKTGATALRLGFRNSLPRVAEAATLGWRSQPRCGWAPSERPICSASIQFHDHGTGKKRIIEFGALSCLFSGNKKQTSGKGLMQFGCEGGDIANQCCQFFSRGIASQWNDVQTCAADAGIEQQLTDAVSSFGGARCQYRV